MGGFYLHRGDDVERNPIQKTETIRSVAGFSLIELMIIIAIVAILAATATPIFAGYLERTRYARCIVEIRGIEKAVVCYFGETGNYPDSLDQVEMGTMSDPWGNPYQYLKIYGGDTKAKGKVRKDKNMNPINSDFDLYSMGSDGKTATPLTANISLDDIIRANDGSYVGRAVGY